MFFLIIIILSIFSANSAFDLKDIQKGLAKKIEDDDLFFDLFQLRIENNIMKIEQNMNHLKKIEKDINDSINSGRRDEEKCIRKGLSQLRSINYVYPWLNDQLNRIKGNNIRLYMFDILSRADFLNKNFIDTSINIDKCILNILEDKQTDRELVKDTAEARINVLDDRDIFLKWRKSSIRPFK